MPKGELVQSVIRALDILDRVAASDDGLSVGQLAAELGLKRPTAHNLARTLSARGYLQAVGEPARFRLGPAMTEAVDQHTHHATTRRVERAIRQGHAAAPEASWVYTAMAGDELRVTLRIDAGLHTPLRRPTRDVLSPYDSATGLCVWAFAGDAANAQRLSRYPFDAYHGDLWEGFAQFEAFAARAREAGYAQPPDSGSGGFRIAAPVRDARGELVGVLGLFHRPKTDRHARKQLAKLLLDVTTLQTQTTQATTP